MPTPAQTSEEWWVNDQTPDNPFGKSDDYEAFLNYVGSLGRSLTPAIAQQPLVINVTELNDHPDYKAAAIGALTMWSSVTPLEFQIVDDQPWDATTQWMRVVSPELGEPSDGSAFSSNRYVSIGQRFHDTEPNLTDIGGYVFDSFIHEFGHEFGLNHPGLYNYGGPGGVQINYLNNATWIYDRQQYSVMSYFDGIDVGEDTRWSASTPLMADIEAVIRRFFSTVDEDGVRTYQVINLNTGDNTYGFNSEQYGYQLTSSGMQHDIGFVIHDTGGEDTIDFSGSTAGTILDLRAGMFSSVNGHSNNVSIFAGHNADATEYYIENGIGSAFDDVLIGNDGNNVLDGRGGADSMAGGGGDDVYFVDSAEDIVREDADGGNDTIYVLTGGVDLGDIANVENIIYVDGSAVAEDDDRLVFISSDSSLLTFEAKNVRPQGRTAGGMAGIKLAEGARVAAFNVVPAGKVAWTYEEGENGLTSGSGAVVLTVAGDSDALPGTENGAAKVTPLEMYPTKGRATGGVRSQRFLKGQNTLILAWAGLYPLHASTSAGSPVELPKPDMRRDGSGVDLASPIAFIA